MLKIGLTGGISSGKSTVSDFFAELGVPIIDCDKINNTLLEKNAEIRQAIVDHFGADIQTSKGELDRAQLKNKIFKNPLERQWLEALLHPKIISEIKHQTAILKNAPYCIIVIPLLTEVPFTQTLVDRILVVDMPEALQLDRLMMRDHLTKSEAEKILAAQAKRSERLRIANDVIYNKDSKETLHKEVVELQKKYINLGEKTHDTSY